MQIENKNRSLEAYLWSQENSEIAQLAPLNKAQQASNNWEPAFSEAIRRIDRWLRESLLKTRKRTFVLTTNRTFKRFSASVI